MAISLAPECRHDESSQYITIKKCTIDDARIMLTIYSSQWCCQRGDSLSSYMYLYIIKCINKLPPSK